MKSVGICLGASSISLVLMEKISHNIKILKHLSTSHDGNVRDTLNSILESLNLAEIANITVTGRKFRHLVNFSDISEAEAIELAYNFLRYKYPNYDTIVSAGGEAFLAYKLDTTGKIANVFTGNKCASGTGEFFLQQIKRMNLSITAALSVVDKENPYTVAGRCSVFCKSDCTHALNKGESKGKVVAGLCKMMAGKIVELLHKCKPQNILLIGGTSLNHAMTYYIEKQLSAHQTLSIANEATYFEALGAALWALENPTIKTGQQPIFKNTLEHSSFSFLPALQDHTDKVTFKQLTTATAQSGDKCIVGLDVGSTTTKAILLRTADDAILASIYLRTNGDPIKASRQCYKSLSQNLTVPIQIIGLGVTGSGRQIAGLHAGTTGIINEIIAHATAATYFDEAVDTIFEIGGQDAKYTYITNKVPADYAMNEACSAGTGSFLEESAKETMGIDTLEIADVALKSTNPPNFNDQCAAFISSDIKNAIQEGIPHEDIVAGLVYSICQNYTNRVKGNRLVGKKIFMQGGVCYNRAVPIAMAALTGKDIIVPPEPGLMGAYGVALEIKNKLKLGLIKQQSFDLNALANREVRYDQPFVCGGGKEACDRKCNINLIQIDDKKYPFGGACNKYVNMRFNVNYDIETLDLVALREKLIFEKYGPKTVTHSTKKIGILKSLLVNTLYPLYANFFTELGFAIVLAEEPLAEGIEKQGAAFCYPVEQAHGCMAKLLTTDADYIFLPFIMGMLVQNGIEASVTCPLVQGEPYYLKAAFKELHNKTIINPTLDFSRGYDHIKDVLVNIGKTLGVDKSQANYAANVALKKQQQCRQEMSAIGNQILNKLKADPDRIGIVLFGRPYNALSKMANMSIPHKFASRGYLIFPWEFLPYEQQEPIQHMFWSMGQMILKAAAVTAKNPQLFGTYITNFSCGPDSFILNQFRNAMGEKPSLTLELDSHTADAGLDTRIEAFIDVVKSYLQLQKSSIKTLLKHPHQMATSVIEGGKSYIIDSYGKRHQLTDPDVKVIVPSMGDIGSHLLAASLRYVGVNAACLPPSNRSDLTVGRANSSCKECLPYILVAGSILNDIKRRQNSQQLLVYFFADSSGPCRFGQYHLSIQDLIKKNSIKNVAVLPLTSDNGYAGLSASFQIRAWQAIIISDVLADIYSSLLVLAIDKDTALKTFKQSVARIEQALATASWHSLRKTLMAEAQLLKTIPLTKTLSDVPKVALLGEIYVRTDSFSRQFLVERLASKGIVTKVAPVTEFIYFCDYILQKSLYHVRSNWTERTLSIIKGYFKQSYEQTIKNIFSRSGLYEFSMIDIDKLTRNVDHLLPAQFTAGDATLTVAATLTEILDEWDGVISIGPFGCLPSRVAEAVLTETINCEKPKITEHQQLVLEIMKKHPALPFLALESDGNPFPQLIEAKLDIFWLQVARIHQTRMQTLQQITSSSH